ncbi:MAG: hypothetical protein C5B43_01490, partial [Verrucomicrobia bacterium]
MHKKINTQSNTSFFDITKFIPFKNFSNKYLTNYNYFYCPKIKPLFNRFVISIFPETLINGWQFCSPYFSYNLNTLLALGLIASNTLLAILVPIQQNALQAFIDSGKKDSHSIDWSPFFNWATIILYNVVLTATNHTLCLLLQDNLRSNISNLIQNWLHTNTFIGTRYTKKETNNLDAIHNLPHTINKFSTNLVNLTHLQLNSLFQFLGALYALYLNSDSFSLKLGNTHFEIPYLILICFIYAYFYNKLTSWTKTPIKNYTQKTTQEENNLSNLIKNIQSQPQSIALLDGKNFEYTRYSKINNRILKINQKSLPSRFFLSFLKKAHWEYSYFTIPFSQLLIKGTMNATDIINSGLNCMKIQKFICSENQNLESFKLIEIHLNQLTTFKNSIQEYQINTQNCQIHYSYNDQNPIEINIELVEKNSLSPFTLKKTLLPGKRYRILGSNGSGKTTLFEILRQKINPLRGSGKISLPSKDKIFFIPQVPYILNYPCSLLETIFYPHPVSKSKKTLNLINTLLNSFNFNEDLNTQKNWSESLSLGQKQQIFIVSAIIKNPTLLLADEPFASLDSQNHIIATNLLNQY